MYFTMMSQNEILKVQYTKILLVSLSKGGAILNTTSPAAGTQSSGEQCASSLDATAHTDYAEQKSNPRFYPMEPESLTKSTEDIPIDNAPTQQHFY